MTTVLPHVKIAWGGSIGSPAVEVWTNSLAWMPKAGGDWAGIVGRGQQGTADNISALSTAIGQWFQTPNTGAGGAGAKGAGISPTVALEWVKLNIIGADGKYMFASNTFFYPAAIRGGGCVSNGQISGAMLPWSSTLAITLRTTISRGRGSKGRIYPPMAGQGPQDATPYVNDVVANNMRAGFTGLINNINSGLYQSTLDNGGYDTEIGAAAGSIGNCCIVSTSPTSGPHLGAAALLTPIYSVEVDLVNDVQTRRVNRVPRKVTGKELVTLNL